jgi:2-polyprenyl-3-methyl-5-hydroxy-6-metoxy-1,4-benzoquinol methylase
LRSRASADGKREGSDGKKLTETNASRKLNPIQAVAPEREISVSAVPICPACQETGPGGVIERYGKYELFGCGHCGLQFWEPREMPDARWYEQMYGGRDEKLLPLEPGHKYFLEDPFASPGGTLLDIGCGTGNFLKAARDAGYEVTGTELDGNAARFAKDRLSLKRVLPLTVSEFAAQHPEEKFDVVTLFEVLEHQAAPLEFLHGVKKCLKPCGQLALSVPNRERWLTGRDVLDYPPNHFSRWNAAALKNFLSAHGFEVLSVREQRAGVAHITQMINMALRTGMTNLAEGGAAASFREVMQMTAGQAEAALQAKPTLGQSAMRMLGRMKHAACFPLALAALPYVRMRKYKGTYLYCLARLKD